MQEDFFLNLVFDNYARVRLPTPVDLTNYEVSVQSLSFPQTFANVPNSIIEYRAEAEKKVVAFPTGFYSDNRALVEQLNHLVDSEAIGFSYDPHRQLAAVHMKSPRASIKLPKTLAMMMKFPQYTLKHDTVSSGPISVLGTSEIAYVVADFTAPVLFNSSSANLLHVTPINQPVVTPLPYMSTRNGIFETFTIEVLHINKYQIPFLGGKTVLRLHFRRKVHK